MEEKLSLVITDKREKPVSLDLENFESSGIRCLVTGISGSGKSNATKVLCEEILRLDLPLFIIDTESEYASLKELKDNVLIIGGNFADIPLDPLLFEDIIELFFTSKTRLHVVLDVGEYSKEDKCFYVSDVMNALYDKATKFKKPFFLVIEECSIFAPERGSDEAITLGICKDVAERGRKRGIHSVWITQRTSRVSKDIIANCNIRILGKMVLENDISKIRFILKETGISEKEIMGLNHEFYLITSDVDKTKIKFRKTTITDLGKTPKFSEKITIKKRDSDAMKSLVEELSKRAKERSEIAELEKTEIEILKRKVKELDSTIGTKSEEITRLNTQLDIMSRLRATTMEVGKMEVGGSETVLPRDDKKDTEIEALKKMCKEKDAYIEKIVAEKADYISFEKRMGSIKSIIKKLNEYVGIEIECEDKTEETSKATTIIELIENPEIQYLITNLKTEISAGLLVDKIMYYLAYQGHEEGSTHQEIADFWGYKTTSAISSISNALERVGLVKRIKVHDHDDPKRKWYMIELDVENIKLLIERNVERNQILTFLESKKKDGS